MVSHFRAEIAGLRAVAVLGVVLFHLKVPAFEGGFVGVDVFFVISGYLITKSILIDLNAGRFSFAQFYVRRMRRIFPALIFTAALTYLAGALWCSPLMFLDVAKETTHALLWISNIQYWRESHQYFSPNSDELALLHCWSLSLEEQFYLAWPVFIVLAQKCGRTFQAIAAAAMVSLLASIIADQSDPAAAFFLTPFRIYEFGCGALVLFCEARIKLCRAAAEGLSAAGLLCVIASMLLFSSDMAHLDVAVLLPCLGAGMTICAGDGTRISKLITNAPMIGIGAISYSLYLCHWPIIFFGRFIFGDVADTPIGMLAMTAAMLVLAIAMYSLVERRFIQPAEFRSASLAKNAAGFWSVILSLAAITHATFLSKGFVWRLPKAQFELAHQQDFPASSDIQGLKGPLGVLFVGDSLGAQYEYGLNPTMKQLNISFEATGGSGCPILYKVTLSRSVRRDECRLARDQGLARLEETALPVIVAQLWRLYDDSEIDYEFGTTDHGLSDAKGSFIKLESALEVTIEKMVARGHRVLIIGAQVDPGCSINLPRIEQGPLPRASQRPCPSVARDIAEQSTAAIDRALSHVQAKWPEKVELLRPVEYLCDAECPVVKGGIWLYASRIHLSMAGANYMAARSEVVFRKFLVPH
jgi:peptidoglycan/LPS O-acetylase OafA/YrhL